MAMVAPVAKTIPLWLSVAVSAGMTALSVGYKFLTQPKGAKGVSRRDWDSNIISTEQHLPVVYGRARLGISPVFVSSGENATTKAYHSIDWLFCVAAICHGEIESIQRIVLNNEEKHALIAKNEDSELKIDEFYDGFVHFGKRLGKNTISKPYKEVQAAFSKWSDNHLGKGVASIYLSLRYNTDKFPAGVPNVTVEIKGTKVHDPRDASYPNDTVAYSNNPALCVLDYLKSTVYGASATEDEIDKNSFIIAANYCDQLLSYAQIDPPSPISAKLIDVDTELYTGSSQQYDYKYALGTLTNISEYAVSSWTVMSDLSAIASCTVTKAYGGVNLSGIANNAAYSRVIFRKELATGTYKMIGSIDPDDDTTIFSDNIKETDLGDAHLIVGSPPAAPSGLVATFKDFTYSKLDTLKYYRYKIVYKTVTGEHTEASDASNKIKTKKSKNAVKLYIPISEDTKTTSREIYRTSGFASGTVPAALDYKLLRTISNNTQEVYYDYLSSDTDANDNSDEKLGSAAPSTNNTLISAQKMFTCNGIVDTSRDVMANLEELLTSCRGRLFYESGKYSLSIRTIAVPEIFELTEDNIIGDWSYTTPGTKEVCNIIKASWTNSDQNWQTDYVIWPPATDNNLYLGDDYGFKINKEIDLPFTTNRKTAKQIAQVTRKETRQTISVSLTAKEEALKLKVNTLVKVTHSSPGWTDKLFWVDAIKILPNATVGLALTEYDPTVYNYELIAKDTVGGADTTLPNPNDPPDEVTNVVIVEEMYGLTPTQISDGQAANTSMPNWRLKVTYINPDSNFWHHSDVYIKKGSNVSSTSYTTEYIQVGNVDRNSNGVFYFAPVEPYITYYLKFVSVSDFGGTMLLDDATEWSHTIDPGLPKTVTNLQAINKGNDITAEGKDFKISWAAISRLGSGFANNASNASIAALDKEKISYDVEVYLSPSFTIGSTTYLGIADSIKFNNNTKVNTKLLNTYNTSETSFTYTYEKNIEDINNAFKNETSNVNYENFYGHSQRTLEFRVYTKNEWGKRSNKYESIKLSNPVPVMENMNGTIITPTYKAGKSSLEFMWESPFGEIDITHFMAKLVGKLSSDSDYSASNMTDALAATKRKNSTAYSIGNIIYPKPANGHCYRCTVSGTTASAQPGTIPKPTDSLAHPTFTDGGVTWQHFGILRFQKVTASINNIEDDDISVTEYTCKFINVDPKKTWKFKTTPHDAHGAGTSSGSIEATSGISDDDTEEDIVKPGTVTGLGFNVLTNGNLRGYWTLLSDTDISEYIYDWRAVNDTSASTPPTLTEIENEITAGSKACYGFISSIMLRGSNEVATKNQFIIQNPQVGYKYFFKVRAKNTSRKSGDWPGTWTTHSVAVPGLSSDNLPVNWSMFKFLGTVTAVDATHVSATITAGDGGIGIRKKTQSGNTPHYIYNMASTAFTGTKFVVFRGGGTSAGSPATLILQTEAEMEADSTVQCAIAKCTTSISGNCKVLMMLSAENFSISAYEGGFNQLSAITADLGTITAGTVTGATIQTATSGARIVLSSDFNIYDVSVLRISIDATNGLQIRDASSNVRAKLAMDGSGWFGDSSSFSWTSGGVVSLDGAKINNSSIDGSAKIANTTVTSGKIVSLAVDKLTTGTISSQTITLTGDGCAIKSGQSGYDSGTGFWLGLAGTTPKFSIGDSTGSKLTWDGSTFTVQGKLIASTASIIDGSYVNVGVIPVAQIPDISVSKLTTGTITSKSITLTISGGVASAIQAGKTSFTSSNSGFWLGVDTDGYGKLVVGAIQKIVISAATNDLYFNGDRGDGTIATLCTIGITNDGSDYIIGDFGNITSGNSRTALRARSYNGATTVDIRNYNGNCLYVASEVGRAAIFVGNTTRGAINIVPVSGVPFAASEGDVAYDSSVHKLICYNGSAWVALF